MAKKHDLDCLIHKVETIHTLLGGTKKKGWLFHEITTNKFCSPK